MTWSGERLLLGGRDAGRGERWVVGERDQRLLLRPPHWHGEQDPLHAQLGSSKYSVMIRWWLVNQNVEKISLLHMLFVLGLCVSLYVQRRTLNNPSQVGLSLTSEPTTFSDQILFASQSTSDYQLPRKNRPHSQYDHGCRPNTYPPRIEKSDRHYGVANGDDLTYLFPVLQVIINF